MKHRRKRGMSKIQFRAATSALLLFVGIACSVYYFPDRASSENTIVQEPRILVQEPELEANSTQENPVTVTISQVYTTQPIKSGFVTIPQYTILTVYTDNSGNSYAEYNGTKIDVPTKFVRSYNEESYLLDLGLEFQYQDLIRDLIRYFDLDIDEYFIYGMMYTESRFSNSVESYAGAQGILQIIPSTWKYLYENIQNDYPELAKTIENNPLDMQSNITLSLYYIKSIQDDYGCDSLSMNAHKVLTTYNRGVGGARKYYQLHNTYVSDYSTEILQAAEYIRVNHTWKEGLL